MGSRRGPALALLLGAIAPAGGCEQRAADEPAGGGEVITLAHTSTETSIRALFDAFEREFEAAHPGADLRQVLMDDDDYQKFGLLNLFTGASSPDIFFQWGGYLVQRDARAGFSRDLTPFLDRGGFRERFIPGAWIGADAGGRPHLIPQALDVSVLIFYNRAIFREQGIEPPRSWEELVEACDHLRAEGITPLAVGNKDLWMMGNWAAHIAARVAGEEAYRRAFSLERGHPFDRPEWIEALGLVDDLVRRRAFGPGAASLTDSEAKSDFIVGRAAMIPIGEWLLREIADSPQRATLDYGFFNTPPIAGGRGDPESIIAVATGFSMGARTRHPELGWALLEEFFRPERQRKFAEAGMVCAVAGAREAQPMRGVEEVIALLEGARTVVDPPDTGYPPAAWFAFYDAVQEVLAGIRGPRQALEEAERAIAAFGPRR